MKKAIFLSLAVVLVAGVVFIGHTAVAKNPKHPADYNGLYKGMSAVHHLYMYEKDASWDIVYDGAWAKMTFNTHMDMFGVNGHGLMPDTEYAVVHYMGDDAAQPWNAVHVMAVGTSDEYGDVHMEGYWGVWEGKFWVVPISQLTINGVGGTDMDYLNTWMPSYYLFEYDVI
jgi:hypothetical protein